MRESLLHEVAAYGVVPAQFTVGALYAAARWWAPVSPLLVLLVVVHVAAPLVFVLARSSGERNLGAMDEQYRAPMGGGDNPDPEVHVADLGTRRPAPLRRRLLLYVGTTLLTSLAGAAALYAGVA